MSDYMSYIDFRAINLADRANEIGDYSCAAKNYAKALKKLRHYQGESVYPITMASELEEKINNAKSMSQATKLKVNYMFISSFRSDNKTEHIKLISSNSEYYVLINYLRRNEFDGSKIELIEFRAKVTSELLLKKIKGMISIPNQTIELSYTGSEHHHKDARSHHILKSIENTQISSKQKKHAKKLNEELNQNEKDFEDYLSYLRVMSEYINGEKFDEF